jgi:hypothetical protein
MKNGSFDANSGFTSLEKNDYRNQQSELLFIQYCYDSRIELDVQAGGEENEIKTNGLNASATGFSDSIIFVRYNETDESDYIPYVTTLVQIKLPTGKYQDPDPSKLGTDLTGTGSCDIGAGLIVAKTFNLLKLHLDAAYSVPIETKIDGQKIKFGDFINWDFGAEFFLPDGFSIIGMVDYLNQGDNKIAGADAPGTDSHYLIISPALGWQTNAAQLFITYQRTIAGKNIDAYDTFILSAVIPL